MLNLYIEQLFYILAGLDGPAPPLQGPGQFCGSTSGSHAGFHTPMGQRAGFPAAAVRLFFCGKKENQVNAGKNRSGSQRCFCKECKKYYTLNPKTREYPEEVRQQAIKTFYAGASGRGVGKVFGFSKANVYNWIKKNGSDSEE